MLFTHDEHVSLHLIHIDVLFKKYPSKQVKHLPQSLYVLQLYSTGAAFLLLFLCKNYVYYDN